VVKAWVGRTGKTGNKPIPNRCVTVLLFGKCSGTRDPLTVRYSLFSSLTLPPNFRMPIVRLKICFGILLSVYLADGPTRFIIAALTERAPGTP
jgi:hypothetical protein